MKITVKVKINQKEEKVEYIEAENIYILHTKEPAKENKANMKVIEILSEKFHIPKRNITITYGLKNRNKIVNIDEN